MNRWVIFFVAAALALAAVPVAAQFPAQGAASTVGTMLVAHGGGEEWNAGVMEIARMAETGGPVEVSFLMGEGAKTHRFQDAARELVEQGATEIVVVPVLASSHSSHYQQIRYLAGKTDTLSEVMTHHLHTAGIERPDVSVPMRLTASIDDSPEVARVLADHANELAEAPEAQALFIIGHGPNGAEDYAEWMARLRPVADSVQALTGFRNVMVGLVRDDAPDRVRAEAVRRIREIITLQHEVTGREVVVVPILVSNGWVGQVKIRRDLEGLPVVYRGNGVLPHPEMARWVERRVREATRLEDQEK
ncbi:MAG: sirohydrochlorin chelatase [Longimicrobiaceae bacterium]